MQIIQTVRSHISPTAGRGISCWIISEKAFGITDYIWYQLPDGAAYVGGAEKALFAGRPIEIPHEFNQGRPGNSRRFPVQSLRPGVELNGERGDKSPPAK